MNAPSWMSGPPRKILLATDLSARCDRALDRAISLVGQWQAQLVVLHALEEAYPDVSDVEQMPSWRRPPDPLLVARRQLLSDVGEVMEKATILIDRGDPVEAIMHAAEVDGCDLIVVGVARDELFGRFTLGRTVDRLLRRSRIPVLVVKDRPRGPYRNIVVATDFSDSSRHALDAAAHFFPEQRLTLFHAFDTPMSGLAAGTASYREEYRKAAVEDCEAFLQNVQAPTGKWPRPHVLIEYGTPANLLRAYARDKNLDLVVLGTHGRGALFEILIGSIAKQIMDNLPCDALVVREPRAAVAA